MRGWQFSRTPQRAARQGFTLVELLVVITIIGVLIGILIPVVNNAIQTTKNAESEALLVSIDTALTQYKGNTRLGASFPPSSPDVNQNINRTDPVDLRLTWYDRDGDRQLESLEKMSGAQMLHYFLTGNRHEGGWLVRSFGAENKINSQISLQESQTALIDEIPLSGNVPINSIETDYDGTNRVIIEKQSTMPVLYFRANPSANVYDTTLPQGLDDDETLLYNFLDNNIWFQDTFNLLGSDKNPFSDAPGSGINDAQALFETMIGIRDADNPNQGRDQRPARPANAQGYLLMMPGADGIYGTTDDITNFSLPGE